jgi:hypothetical protein
MARFSHLVHYIKYNGFKSNCFPVVELKKGMLITSIDLDVGNRRLGIINAGKNDINVNYNISEYQIGAIEEIAIPFFMRLFDEIQMPVTIAIRGQLLQLGDNVLRPILESSINHDIGAHGYSHRSFTDMSIEEAKNELELTGYLMRRMSIIPKSFIFPKSKVAHLNLLGEHGYRCYRGHGNILNDGMYIRQNGQIYDVHPSLQIDQWSNPFLMKKMLDICIHKRLPLHVWFHPWRFGQTSDEIQKSIKNIFLPFLQYAGKKVDAQELSFETMFSSINEL